MAPQFSLAYLSVLGTDPAQQTYLAARAGYDFVSLRPIHMGLPGEPNFDLATQPELRRAVERALDQTGVRLHDIELARIAEDDPARYRDAFEVSAALGATAVISSIWIPDRAEYLDKFAQVCALAEEFGLFVGLEFVPIAEVDTLEKTIDVLRTVDAPNAGMMPDTYHVDRCGARPEQFDGLPASWFRFCHICDAPARAPESTDALRDELRERRLYLGEGGLPVADLLNRLPEMVYSIELPHAERWETLGMADHAARCLATARRYFAEHVRPGSLRPAGSGADAAPPASTGAA